jgi:hypothetical protein
MLRCVNDGIMTIKPGHQATGNMHMIWSDETSFMLFCTSGRVDIWRTPREAYNLECQYSVGPIITLYGQNTVMKYVDRLGNRVHPTIQSLFLNNDAVFLDHSAPTHPAGTVQSWFEEHEVELQHLPSPTNSSDLNVRETLWSVLDTRVRNRFPLPTCLKKL